MSKQEAKPPSPGVPLLGRALAGAAVGRSLSAEERKVLSSATCFPGACSVRVALPLSDEGNRAVLVSSDLRTPTSPPSYWATPWERSLVGRTLAIGRTATAEGPAVEQLVDLRHLAARGGGGSFLCIPVFEEEPLGGLDPGPAVAALLLCYPSSADVSQEELRQALLLAVQLTRQHGRELDAYAGQLCRAMHPEEHSEWGPGFDEDYPEVDAPAVPFDSPFLLDSDYSAFTVSPISSSGAGSSSGTGSAGSFSPNGSGSLGSGIGLVAAAAVRSRPLRWAMSASTLRFADEHTEQKFQRWRNSRLAKVDAVALMALLLYHASACVLPPSQGCSPLWLGSSLPAAVTVLVPLLMVLFNRSHSWYSRHRDQLLICTYVLLACHQALDVPSQVAAAAAVPVGLWRGLTAHMELLWSVALAIILQVQFVGQCLMLVGGLALKALVKPGCACRLSGHHLQLHLQVQHADEPQACLINGVARLFLLNVILPCGLAYYTELSARRNFCRAMMERRCNRR